MSLFVVVERQDDFDRWLARQATPVSSTTQNDARGAELFLSTGCGACHSIRGTAADGVIGPDLTHVGSRESIGAGTLARQAAAFQDWISRTDDIKPGVHMPPFGMLPLSDRQELASYLEVLE
jgi:cytochrome c oxidase subunit 2